MFFFKVEIKAKTKKMLLTQMLRIMRSMVDDYYQHDTQDCKSQFMRGADEKWVGGFE
jgi:hypothetical protein